MRALQRPVRFSLATSAPPPAPCALAHSNGVPGVVARQAGAAEQGFDAAVLAAVAGPGRVGAGLGPGQGVVAPLAGQAVRALQHTAVHRDARTGAGAQDGGKHHAGPGARAIGGLGQGETICVVGQTDWLVQTRLKVPVKWLADQAGGIGVFH